LNEIFHYAGFPARSTFYLIKTIGDLDGHGSHAFHFCGRY
jgi:hypothetical protein